MTRDGDGMTVEVVKGDALGKEQVERHTDVRSVELPSTRGMVRLDDVVALLEEHDDVPASAVHAVAEEIDDDPSTGGHIRINSPSSMTSTALFERVEIFAAKVDNARGSAVCGPDETWLNVVIPRELDEQIFDAVKHDPNVDVYNRSTLVEQAVGEYLDDADPVEEAGDDELIAELEQRGFDVVEGGGTDPYEDVIGELTEWFARATSLEGMWLEDLTGPVSGFELAHVEALEEYTDIPGSEKAGNDLRELRYHLLEAPNDGQVYRAFEKYHGLPVEDGGEDGDE